MSAESIRRRAANTSPAELKHRITLQYQTRTPDGAGAWTTTWNDAATVWAAIWPGQPAREAMAAGAPSAELTHRIRIRYRADVRASWRIKYGQRFFAIVAPPINPNEDSIWLDILCKEAA